MAKFCLYAFFSYSTLLSMRTNETPEIQLFEAIKRDDLVTFTQLVTNCFNPKDDYYCNALLQYAIDESSYNIVHALVLNKKVNINYQDTQGNTPLHYAIIRQNILCAQTLASRDDLDLSLRNNNKQTIASLTQSLRAPNKNTVYRALAQHYSKDPTIKDAIQKITEQAEKELRETIKSIFFSLYLKETEVAIKEITDANSNRLNSKTNVETGDTLLIYSCKQNMAPVAQTLIRFTDLNNLIHKNKEGKTALDYAKEHKNSKLIEELETAETTLKTENNAQSVAKLDGSLTTEINQEKLETDDAAQPCEAKKTVQLGNIVKGSAAAFCIFVVLTWLLYYAKHQPSS